MDKPIKTLSDTGLHALALILLLASLLHPAIPWQRDLHNYLLVADVTQSMNTEDMKLDGKNVSRMAYMRHLMHDTVAALPCGTDMSLGVFSNVNIALLFTPIEVCANYDVIEDAINHLEWRMAWHGNSRLRFGMQSANAILQSLPEAAQLVFFTDGDEAPKLNAINKTDLSNWQGGSDWLLVGVGGDDPMPVPKFDGDDRIMGYWSVNAMKVEPSAVLAEESAGTRDDSIATDDNDRYLSKLDEPYLKELAQEIDASYLRAGDSGKLVEAMRRQKPAARATEKVGIDRLLIALAALVLLSAYWPGLMLRIRGRPARTPA
ncbi:MAG TPA: VWA domain-containing protein [Novimethylophilus sp.]